MEFSGERFLPRIDKLPLARSAPFIRTHARQSYEHWHRYLYSAPFVAGKSVLDIASGEGYGSALLAAHAAVVYGVDIAEDAIAHSRRTYVRDNLHFLQGSADAIPIPGQHRFDVVVSFETIEHLDAPTQERFAAEVKRLLKPDGIFLVSTPNRTVYSDARDYKNEFHLHEYYGSEFNEFLSNYFNNVYLLGQHVYPASQIWNLDGKPGPLVEYQIAFDSGALQPVATDSREAVYLIAICTDRDELEVGPGSLLVDLSEVAFQGLPASERWQTCSLFIDTGLGFRAEEEVHQEIGYGPEFTIKFTLDPAYPVRALRFDPLEQRLCQVRLHRVIWEDGQGTVFPLDLGRVTSNGTERDGGSFEFETLDPSIYLPVSGSVATLTIEGECQPASESDTLAGLERAVSARTQVLLRQAEELDAVRRQLSWNEQSIASYRHQLARQDHDLNAARHQLDLHSGTIWVLTEQLHHRESEIERLAARIKELEQDRAALDAKLHEIVVSKRWIVINWIRSALYYLPERLRSRWRDVRSRLPARL